MGVCEVVDSTVARYTAGIWKSPSSVMSTVISCPSSEVLVHRDGEDQHIKDVDMDGSTKSSDDKTEEESGGQYSSGERRNKRKNFRPRNITDISKDGHQDVDVDMDETEVLGLSTKTLLPKTPESFPMDLSVKPGQELSAQHKNAIDLSCKATTSPDDTAVSVPRQHPSPNLFPAPAEASNALKDYAESTMRELLGIYGLGDNHDLSQKRNKPFPQAPGSAMMFQHYPSRSDLVSNVKDVKSSPLHPPTPPDTPRILKPSPSPSMSENSEGSFLERSSVLENGMDDSSSSVISPVFRDNKIENIPYSFSGIADGAGRNYPSPSLAETSMKSVASLMNQVAAPLGSGIYSFSTKEPSSKVGQNDYSHYVKRYSSANECGSNYCKDLSYREHFHCVDCNSRVFVKKEEMIRHFKWHKKRDESLQHGFMRYSPADDCSDRFNGCSHNRKQTHYHCLKEGCDKVYISTSDVQMHANYHRKDSAILQEGFQRFRGCEDCGQSYCSYQGQKTTHFHCRRQGCQFTFKNKGDMDKHKSYHIKDDQLNKDGFKKYMKHEDCPFKDCRFSRVCNHIHCIRQGCSYVLHSSGQLYSHKRKHERRDTEMAYRKYQLTQSLIMGMELGDRLGGPALGMHSQLTGTIPTHLPVLPTSIPSEIPTITPNGRTSPGSYKAEFSPAELASRSEVSEDSDRDSSSIEIKTPSIVQEGQDVPPAPSDFFSRLDSFENLARFIVSSQERKCPESCHAGAVDHYHCRSEGCSQTFTSLEGAKEHMRNHVFQEMITQTAYMSVSGDSACPVAPECSLLSQNHFHCLLEGCKEAISREDTPFKRLEHYNMHDYSRRLSHSSLGTPIVTPIDGIFRRKRGRPPKNRVIELPMTSSSGNSSTALFTSFKLPKPSNDVKPCSSFSSSPPPSIDPLSMMHPNNLYNSIKPKMELEEGFYVFDGTQCPDRLCPHQSQKHYHCSQPRCFYVTDRADILILHSKDFHDNIYILEGFNFFDRSVDCRQANCVSNKINRHFHCTRPDCGFSFVRYSTMSSHEKHHQTQDSSEAESRDQNVDKGQNNGTPHTSPSSPGKEAKVKAAGTFYPLSAFPMNQPSKAHRVHQSPESLSEPANNMQAEDGLHGSKCPTEGKIEERLSFSMHGIPSAPPVIFPGGMYPPQLTPAPQIMYSPENACGRPFCKLKRKDHYHCHVCSQAFTEYEKLHSHLLKHITCGTLDQTADKKEDSTPRIKLELNGDSMEMDNSFQSQTLMNKFEHSLPQHPAISSYMFPPGFGVPMGYPILGYPHGALLRTQAYVPCSSAGYNFSLARGTPTSVASNSKGNLPESRNVQGDPKSVEVSEEVSLSEAKRCRLNPMRLLKDEPVPEGYIRYRFNEDCGYSHCGYREHQTHFHCTRKDCGYSFCDKTRFVQHTARHERLDTLMGGDFHQFRSTIACGRPDCDYTNSAQNKSSHFHCLKCDFVCTDTNKVVAHRRQHQKLDSIMAAGFEKFTPSQGCNVNGCQHNHRQTHYHCMQCHFAVLGLSQMSAHRYRHEQQ